MSNTIKALLLAMFAFQSSTALAQSSEDFLMQDEMLSWNELDQQYRECLVNFSGGGDSVGGKPNELIRPFDIPDIYSPDLLVPEGLRDGRIEPPPRQTEPVNPETTPQPTFQRVSFEFDETDRQELDCWMILSLNRNELLELREILSLEIQRLLDLDRNDEAQRLLRMRAQLYRYKEI